MESARLRGHDVCGLDATHCDLSLTRNGISIASECPEAFQPLPDVALTRIPSLADDHVRDVVRQVEGLGIKCFNSAQSLRANRNKISSYAALAAQGLPIPKTFLVMPHEDKAARNRSLEWILSLLPSAPWIMKLPDGSKGQGVMIAESLAALRSMVDVFAVLKQPVLLQECIAGAMSTNIRALVFGGKFVSAVERNSRGGEFRANAALGAQGHVLKPDQGLISLAERAAKVFNLTMAGIDLVRDGDGYLIIEVNSSPGLIGPQKNIDETTPAGMERVNLCSALMEYLEREAAI